MSKPELVKERQPAAFVPGGDDRKSVKEELLERREAIEQIREEREKPRKDFMLTGKGKASDFFEKSDNKDFIDEVTGDPASAPKPVEEYSESEREAFLRSGDLIPAKKEKAAAKKEEQAAKPPERPKLADFVKDGQADNERYEQALDKYETDKAAFDKQQSAKQNEAPAGDLDKETFEEFKSERQDFWNDAEHQEAHKTLPDRMVRVIQSLTPAEKQVLANSPVGKMQLHGDLDGYLMHALSRVKNLGRVLVVLNKDVPLMERINSDYAKTEGNSQKRFESQQMIRYVLKYIDKQVAKMSNEQWHGSGASANDAERAAKKLTSAGRPPLEAGGGTSSPADDGSADAAWKRKDLSAEEKGELYRERRNREESEARRKKHPRRTR